MIQKTEYLYYFYKITGLCGGVGLAIAWLIGSWSGALSYGLGFLSIAMIVGSWHLTLQVTLGPRKTSWLWESLLIFPRYILLGGLFYAMISLFAVRWAFYIAGTTTILPGLLISTLLHEKNAKPSS